MFIASSDLTFCYANECQIFW